MARLLLEKINGEWWLTNKASGKILAKTTEETRRALRYITSDNGRFTLEVA